MRATTLLALATMFVPIARSPLAAQTAGSHLIVVQMVDKSGQYAFQPTTITAQHGDTVRFVQASTAPHNVDFKKAPKGARIAGQAGPYLIDHGAKYDLMIDGRFTDGTYQFVCDPHEGMGMTGTLVVGAAPK
jgi:plastocyanin